MAEIGIIGLGKMGGRIANHLLRKGQKLVVYDKNKNLVKNIGKKGAKKADSLMDLVKKLPKTKVIILLVPADKVSKILTEILPFLEKGDIVIDAGNSFYKDSQKRANALQKRGIYFLDAGLSGGISGAEDGACIMIGGSKAAFQKTKLIFKKISKNGSYRYLGESGTGHLVKGYHNFVEYGYLQSLAEGLHSLSTISKKENLRISITDVCDIWNKGSIIESRLVKDAKTALEKYPSLNGIPGSVDGQTFKEMENLAKISRKMNVPTPCCSSAISARKKSLKRPTFAGKIINATRNIFGGHKEWK